jgi:hypothetical protein
MKNGSKACAFCGSRFTFEEFELVDSMPADTPCDGCVQLYAILEASARDKAAKRRPEQLEVMDLSPSAILSRLLENRRRASEPKPQRDWMMAAAGEDRE